MEMIKMLKVKEILLRFQEDTKFIEKVAKSNTIDKLYEVFCEYEYDSDINSFESEIYELLSNSDLVQESVDEEELERISGGASIRKKIMSVIALSSLAMGGIAPSNHVDAANVVPNQKNTAYSHVEVGNVATKRRRKKHVDTLLPPPEWKALGVTGLVGTLVLLSMRLWNKSTKKPQENPELKPIDELGATNGSNYNTFENTTQIPSLNRKTAENQAGEGNRSNVTLLMHRLSKQQYDEYLNAVNNQNEQETLKFITALNRISDYYENNDTKDKFPKQIIDDMNSIRDRIFGGKNPERNVSGEPEPPKLLEFPPNKTAYKNDPKSYFAPISNINGEATLNQDDPYMLSKVIFQYLSRILCLTLIYNGPASKNTGNQRLVNCLSGYDENTSDNPVCYKDLLNPAGINNKFDWEKYPFQDEIPALCRTLRLMCSHAETEGKLNEKCGVYGVKGTRGNVN